MITMAKPIHNKLSLMQKKKFFKSIPMPISFGATSKIQANSMPTSIKAKISGNKNYFKLPPPSNPKSSTLIFSQKKSSISSPTLTKDRISSSKDKNKDTTLKLPITEILRTTKWTITPPTLDSWSPNTKDPKFDMAKF